MSFPPVALIIPALDADVEPLLASVRRQSVRPAEIAVVRGVRPNGRARNQGVARTSAPLLMFVDDDALLGDEHVIERLVAPLLADPSIGVTGASKLLPPDASWFQRWVAREVPRITHPIVDQPLESNPDPPSFYCEITTTCCAMRRSVFEAAGGFDDALLRGVDTEFFVRIRRLGLGDGGQAQRREELWMGTCSPSPIPPPPSPIPRYRFLLIPHTWTYHPAPANLRALLRKHFLYGIGHAQEVRRDQARARGRALQTPLHAAAFVLFRTAILLPNIFLPYSFAAPSWRLGFKPLKALTSY